MHEGAGGEMTVTATVTATVTTGDGASTPPPAPEPDREIPQDAHRTWLPGTFYDSQFLWNASTHDVCPAPSSDRYVLIYDSQSGEMGPLDDSVSVTQGQQVVVCVINPDYRDEYAVQARLPPVREIEQLPETTFRVGEEDTINVGADPDRQRPELMAQGRGQASDRVIQLAQGSADEEVVNSFTASLIDAVAMSEARRAAMLAALERAFARQMTRDAVEHLRDSINEIVFPSDLPPHPAEGGGLPCPTIPRSVSEWMNAGVAMNPNADASGVAPRCYLPHWITYGVFPEGASFVDGHLVVDPYLYEQVTNASPNGVDSFEMLADQIATSLEYLIRTEAFTQSMLETLAPPTHVFNLGRFDGNSEVTLTLVRNRRTLEVRENDELHVGWDRTETRHRLQVHDATYFRIEPGIALSTLRRPSFEIGTNDVLDQVITVADEGRTPFAPIVVASYYWCGVDLRLSPFQRRCPSGGGRRWARVVPHLPSLMVGIPLDGTFFGSARGGSIYLGAAVDWIPYVSLGVGANLSYGVTRLRDGFHVGDPLPTGLTSIDSVTTTGVVVVPYVSFTISGDVFKAIRGFDASN